MSVTLESDDGTLVPKVIFAMPLGPPYGGMTTHSRLFLASSMFSGGRSVLFDTTPPAGEPNVVARFLYSCLNTGRLLRLVRRERADVVHFMTSDYLGFYEKSAMALLCQLFGARSVLHPVGSFVNFYGRAEWGRPVIRFILRRIAAVAAVQERVQSYIRALAPDTPVWLIPNPVDCRLFTPPVPAPSDTGKVRIVFCGAVVEGKGIFDLLEAARLFRARLQRAEIIVLGDGPALNECERRVRDYELRGLVELKGFVDERTVRGYLLASHIFCLPSYSEGMPISVLEAMATGLPIVATSVGGIPFAVRQGFEGWLVPPGDVDGLGRALVNLVDSAPVRHAMGRRGCERVNKFYDVRIVASMLSECLNSLAERPGNGARQAGVSTTP